MSLHIKKLLTVFLIALLIMVPFGASVMAQESSSSKDTESSAAMTLDLLLLRPLGFLGMLGGTVIFALGSPFSALGGNIKESFDQLMVVPTKYTFARPLGKI